MNNLYLYDEEGFGWFTAVLGGAVSLYGQHKGEQAQAKSLKAQRKMLEAQMVEGKSQRTHELMMKKLGMLSQKKILIPLLIGVPIFVIAAIILLKKLK